MITEEPKKSKLKYLFLIPIVIIATCNIIVNTQSENEDKAVINNPKPGDYYVFHRNGATYQLAFKVKEVTTDKIVFYVPQYELGTISGNREKLGSYIYEMDSKKKLYGIEAIEISKSVLNQMTDKTNGNKQVQISEELTLSFVDSYKGFSKKSQ